MNTFEEQAKYHAERGIRHPADLDRDEGWRLTAAFLQTLDERGLAYRFGHLPTVSMTWALLNEPCAESALYDMQDGLMQACRQDITNVLELYASEAIA